jgi:hypothetical protein
MIARGTTLAAFEIIQNNLLLHTWEGYKGAWQRNSVYGGKVEIQAISEFTVFLNVYILFQGPKNQPTSVIW